VKNVKGTDDVLQARPDTRQQIFTTAVTVQEQERRRIAANLHSGLCQLLYGVKLSLHALEKEIRQHPQLKKAEGLLAQAIAETRSMAHQLMPVTLEKYGLEGALRLAAEQLGQPPRFSFAFRGLDHRIGGPLEIAVYRIVQELMLNAVKHAEASLVEVRLAIRAAQVNIRVRDNGKGFGHPATEPGHGLDEIRAQVALLEGSFAIREQPGTEVRITLPLPASPG
jgi:signal transduction histidine kinase